MKQAPKNLQLQTRRMTVCASGEAFTQQWKTMQFLCISGGLLLWWSLQTPPLSSVLCWTPFHLDPETFDLKSMWLQRRQWLWCQSQTKLLQLELSTLSSNSSINYTTINPTASVFFLCSKPREIHDSLSSFHLLSSYHYWWNSRFHFTNDHVISVLKSPLPLISLDKLQTELIQSYLLIFSLQLVRRKPSPPPLFKTFPCVISSSDPLGQTITTYLDRYPLATASKNPCCSILFLPFYTAPSERGIIFWFHLMFLRWSVEVLLLPWWFLLLMTKDQPSLASSNFRLSRWAPPWTRGNIFL